MERQRSTVLNKIDEIRDDVLEILKEIIRIPSITPKYPGVRREEVLGGETLCNQTLSRFYEQIGCRVDLWEEERDRANLVGVLEGVGGGRSLIFNGHIDIVPPGPREDWKWNDPYSGRVEDGRLYGRGSCDMKGGIVAQYADARALVECGIRLRGDLILESVVGEETMDHEAGTSAAVRRGYRADGAIVSEPTSGSTRVAVAPASAGMLYMTVTCPGVAGHPGARFQFVRAGGAGPSAGVNAVEKGVLVLKALQDLEKQWGFSKRHPLFPPGYFTLHPGVIVGGPPGPLVPFIVSTYCRTEYIIWYPPQEPVEMIKEEVADYIAKAAALDPWLAEHPPRIEWKNHWPPYEIDEDHPIVRTCAACRDEVARGTPEFREGRSIQGFLAVCDATFLNQAGIPTITCGPGACSIAHQCNESLPIDELVFAAKTYALAAMDWCGTS
ncbi:MAG: ArgE/DapE family deacylase [Deltaproteobacteria bacterium]|nr:ArgE/DapE family deacylase [Deltaproteobacteria bacterium]